MKTRASARQSSFLATLLVSLATVAGTRADVPPPDLQPLRAQIRRVLEALDSLGAPLDAAQLKSVNEALAESS